MLKRISLVFIGDGVAKALNLTASIFVLKMLSVSDYANFSILFASIMLSYQSISGVFERFYISDYKAFKDLFLSTSIILGCPIVILGFFYLDYTTNASVSVLFIAGYLCFFLFQSLRILYQREELFKHFVISDFIRNFLWLSLLIIAWSVNEGLDFNLVACSLIASAAISVIIILLFGKKTTGLTKIAVSASLIKQSTFYLKERYELLIYALAAGIFPYIPIIASTLISSEDVTASYGAAMRFQAIFSMCIYATNVVFLPRIVGLSSKEAIGLLASFYKKLPFFIVAMFILALTIVHFIDFLNLSKFQDLKNCFWFFVVCSMFSMASAPAANFLLSKKRYSVLFFAMASGLLAVMVLIPFMLMLSKFYGILGALLVGYFSICMLILIGSSRVIHENSYN